MSMIETPAEKPAVKPKRKPRKAVKRAAKPKAEPVKAAFPGLTESECASRCSVKGCVISGTGICGHPRKGGLQVDDPIALARLQQAQKQLGITAVDKRFG